MLNLKLIREVAYNGRFRTTALAQHNRDVVLQFHDSFFEGSCTLRPLYMRADLPRFFGRCPIFEGCCSSGPMSLFFRPLSGIGRCPFFVVVVRNRPLSMAIVQNRRLYATPSLEAMIFIWQTNYLIIFITTKNLIGKFFA